MWYDFIRRDLYQSGKLEKLIREDKLAGMTSNPTIFQKAIAETDLYDEDILRLAGRGENAAQVFEGLAVVAAALGVGLFRAGWPDLVVAVALLVLFLRSATRVLRDALREFRRERQAPA